MSSLNDQLARAGFRRPPSALKQRSLCQIKMPGTYSRIANAAQIIPAQISEPSTKTSGSATADAIGLRVASMSPSLSKKGTPRSVALSAPQGPCRDCAVAPDPRTVAADHGKVALELPRGTDEQSLLESFGSRTRRN